MQQLTSNVENLDTMTVCWKCSQSLSDKFIYNYEDNIKNNDYVTQIQSNPLINQIYVQLCDWASSVTA